MYAFECVSSLHDGFSCYTVGRNFGTFKFWTWKLDSLFWANASANALMIQRKTRSVHGRWSQCGSLGHLWEKKKCCHYTLFDTHDKQKSAPCQSPEWELIFNAGQCLNLVLPAQVDESWGPCSSWKWCQCIMRTAPTGVNWGSGGFLPISHQKNNQQRKKKKEGEKKQCIEHVCARIEPRLTASGLEIVTVHEKTRYKSKIAIWIMPILRCRLWAISCWNQIGQMEIKSHLFEIMQFCCLYSKSSLFFILISFAET